MEWSSVDTDVLVQRVLDAGDPADGKAKARYLQAFPGGYAEGDVVIGVRVPVLRQLARSVKDDVTLIAVEDLLTHEVHEVRLLGALLLVEVYRRRRGAEADGAIVVLLRLAGHLDNWDLVDTAAPYTLGPWLLDRPDETTVLDELARSPVVWRRRLAVVATLGLIRGGSFEPTLRLAARLLEDPHDLIHKAVGWMLREVGLRDRALLDGFLDEQASHMPRVMLRYAVEKHAPDERARYRALPRRC